MAEKRHPHHGSGCTRPRATTIVADFGCSMLVKWPVNLLPMKFKEGMYVHVLVETPPNGITT